MANALATLVAHTQTLDAEAGLDAATQSFEPSSYEYCAAVASDGKVLGVCSLAHIRQLLSGRYGFALHARSRVRDELVPGCLRCNENTPLRTVPEQAMSRRGDAFYQVERGSARLPHRAELPGIGENWFGQRPDSRVLHVEHAGRRNVLAPSVLDVHGPVSLDRPHSGHRTTAGRNDTRPPFSKGRLNLPAVLERSRSGRGARVWFFFEEAIPATLARPLGSPPLNRLGQDVCPYRNQYSPPQTRQRYNAPPAFLLLIRAATLKQSQMLDVLARTVSMA